MADLEEAISCNQYALRQVTSSTITRVLAGREVLRYCAITSDWQQAYEALDIAVHLVPNLTSRSLENSDKQHILSQIVSLASDAAAAALNAKKGPLVALNFLEQGPRFACNISRGNTNGCSGPAEKAPGTGKTIFPPSGWARATCHTQYLFH
jgi:hypothetical protein